MKKILLAILVFSLFTLEGVFAQGLEITPFTGYNFNHSFPIVGGRATLGGGQAFGGFLGYQFNDFNEVEFLYSFQRGTSTARSSQLPNVVSATTDIHFVMIGLNRLFPISSQAALFSGLKMGAGTVASPNNEFGNISRFTVGVNGGVKYFVSDNVGIRLQAQLMLPISNVGAGFWWSPGGGSGVSLNSWSSIIQFGLGGGLILRIPSN